MGRTLVGLVWLMREVGWGVVDWGWFCVDGGMVGDFGVALI